MAAAAAAAAAAVKVEAAEDHKLRKCIKPNNTLNILLFATVTKLYQLGTYCVFRSLFI